MINFFRRIRKKLADDNKPLKYMRYAIGEIVLVVIGILIALSINNWNENRKDIKIELNSLIDLHHEFQSNKNIFDPVLQIKKKALSDQLEYFDLLKESKETFVDIKKGFESYGLYTFSPSNGVINSLISSGGINKIRNKSLKYALTGWIDKLADYQEEEFNQLEFFLKQESPFRGSHVPPYGGQFDNQTKAEIEKDYLDYAKLNEHRYHVKSMIEYLRIQVKGGEKVQSDFNEILNLLNLEIDRLIRNNHESTTKK